MQITHLFERQFTQWTAFDKTLPDHSCQEILSMRAWNGETLIPMERYAEDRIVCVLWGCVSITIETKKIKRSLHARGSQFVIPAHSNIRFSTDNECMTAHFPRRQNMDTIETVTTFKEGNFTKWLFRGFGLGNREAAIIAWEQSGQSDPHDHSKAELQGVLSGRLHQHFWMDACPVRTVHYAGTVTHIPAGRKHVVRAPVKTVSMMYYYEGPVLMNTLSDFVLVDID